MKIKSMTATFGRLERAHLDLTDGLNLLYAPNEGGKSTWAAFWKAMLYGIDTRDRDKKGYLADKNRYQPWSGLPMEGEVVLEWQGVDITLRRRARGNIPFGQFSAVYTKTQEPVEGLTGENCGQMLTGVSREVFERSSFIGAGGELSISQTPELERRIAALVSSGQEDVSYSQVESRLKEWLNRRKVNRTVGLIPKLESELTQVRDDVERCCAVKELIARLEREQEELISLRKDLLGEQEIHQRLEQEELNQRFAHADEDYQRAQEQFQKLERELSRFGTLPEREMLKRAQGELQYLKVLEDEIRQGDEALKQAELACEQAQQELNDEFFQGLSAQEAQARRSKDISDYGTLLKRAESQKKWSRIWIVTAFLWLALCGCLAGFRVLPQVPCLVIGGVNAAFWVIYSTVYRNRSKQAILKAQKILEGYRVESTEALTELVEDYVLRYETAQQASKNVGILRAGVNDRKARRENSKADLLEFVHQFAPEVSDLFGCSAALSRALNLEHELALAKERVQERLRRREDLEAQGGQLISNLAYYHTPQRTPEETRRALVRVNADLERVQQQLNQAKGKQSVMGNSAELEAKKETLEQQLKRRELEYQALNMAMETMKEANKMLQERFSPDLNRLTGAYMARLTGEAYTAVSLNREMEASAVRKKDILPHSALYLSRGTVDQLYLAVRLAVCQLCLPEKPPILLDDALVTFDDQRLKLALELLKELAGEQQILLFTCQSREGRMLEGKG